MSVLVSSSSFLPLYCNDLLGLYNTKFLGDVPSRLAYNNHRCCLKGVSFHAKLRINGTLKCKKLPTVAKAVAGQFMNDNVIEDHTIDYEWGDDEVEIDDSCSPWEGAIVYRRNAAVAHLEYCTTLERLGLGELSTDVSKSRASLMGLRITKAVKDYPNGTPVQVSIDVTRKIQKIRLDGIIRTVLTLGCNRCGEAAAECIFTNFSFLLTEEAIEDSEVMNMGFVFGEDKLRKASEGMDQGDEDEASIDLDDRLYFPPEEKEIDLSKHIRDMIHVEITLNALCDPGCKGLCYGCGMNLNTSSCSCGQREVVEKGFGPLSNLKKQMQS